MEDHITKKRKRVNDDEDDGGSTAITATMTTTMGATSNHTDFEVNLHQQVHFLPFHLRVLKSLYDYDDGEDLTPTKDTWDAIEGFLKNRQNLINFKTNAVRYRAIHKQALRFASKHASTQQSTTSAIATTTTATTPVSSPLVHKINTPRSGGLKSVTTTPSYTLHRPSQLLQRTPNGSAKANKQQQQRGPFILVARILEQRAKNVDSTFQDNVKRPYKPLLQRIRQTIEQLQVVKQRHTQALSLQNQKISKQILSINVYSSSRVPQENVSAIADRIREERLRSDAERSRSAATESKIRLWTLLEQELKQLLV